MPLASVVRKRTYSKVDDNNPLALFHKKFLGKSMGDEEAEWQKTQIGGQPEGAMEEDLREGKAIDEVMNVGEATDEDDDILPGCYVLNINIDGIVPKRVWIRADYIRIFNYFQAHYDNYAKPMDQAPSAVITGQPGIGKSFWIYYAARRLLAEMRPFIWFYAARYYLFVDDGVYELPPDWRHSDFNGIIWTLVDSDQKSSFPTNEQDHTEGSRHRESMGQKRDTTNASLFFYPVQFMITQRTFRARLSPLEGITETHVNKIFDQLGPVARLCIHKTSCQLAEYRNALCMATSYITTGDIQKLANEASRLTMDEVADKIFLLSRQHRDDINSRAVVAPITDSIKSRLSNQFRSLQRAEQVRLYQFFEKVPGLRAIAGIFYEAIAQNRLQNGMHLELVPMVKRKGSPMWCSSHIPVRNPSLEAAHQRMLGQRVPVKIQPKKNLEYTDNGLQSIEPNVFYVPALENKTAFGSFILLDGLLYIFQMTTTSSHDINQGIIAIANRCFPSMEKWRFVFIIPPNLTLSVPQLCLRSFSLFSAVVRVDEAETLTKKHKI